MLQAGERERSRDSARHKHQRTELMTMKPVSMISDAYKHVTHDRDLQIRFFCVVYVFFVYLPSNSVVMFKPMNIPMEKVENRSQFLIDAFFHHYKSLVVLTLTTVSFAPRNDCMCSFRLFLENLFIFLSL